MTPSWRYGPFSWWPIGDAAFQLAGGPVEIGFLNFLPVLVAMAWIAQLRRAGSWRWGAHQITLPLLPYTIWSLIRLWGAAPRYLFVYGGNLILVWFIYLYVVNQEPPLRWIFAIVILAQATVGILQFLLQRDLGLTLLGELPLNPQFTGVTVIEARGRHWLRAYGLTAHPNLYGALLATCIILTAVRAGGRSQTSENLLRGIAGFGVIGLFVSFSRAAWLGLVAGLVAWLSLRWQQGWRPSGSYWRWLALLVVLLAGLLTAYGDLALNRFTNLQSPLEARSINQRLSDAGTALQLFSRNPWFGVGYGRYVEAAANINAEAARVHNVLLLTAAELGLPGLLTVLGLFIWPLNLFRRLYRSRFLRHVASGIAPWLLLVIVNQLDTTLWISGNWQTALLFALIAGHVSCKLREPRNRPARPLASTAANRSAE